MFFWWRSDWITPSTKPPQCSRISCASPPSVAPPSASPTAAPARAPTARSVSWCPFTRTSPWSNNVVRAALGRPGGLAGGLAPDRVPPVDELRRQLVEVDLVREVLAEPRRRDLCLPARVRLQRHPVRLLEVRHGRNGVLPAAVVLRRLDDDL